jgi:hypothetical protein
MSQFVSTQIVDLDSPGSDKSNLYYSNDMIKVASIESDNKTKYNQSLTSLAWGSTAEVTIPNQDFLSSTFLYLETPQLPAGAALSDMWAYASIKYINYQFGGSNVSQVQISGESLLQRTLLQAETLEKRNEIRSLSGTLQLGGDMNQIIPSQKAVIQLIFPWSSVSSDKHKLPFDTSLLDSNITIQVVFEDSSKFISVSGVVALPNAFIRGEVITKEQVLTNKANSLKDALKRNSSLMLQYPYVHAQTGSTRYLQNINPEQVVQVDLTSFLSSDLLGISFWVVPQSQLQRTGTNPIDGSGIVNRFFTVFCEDLKLEYNGQQIHNMPWRSSNLITGCALDVGASNSAYSILSHNVTAVSLAESLNNYYLPLTQFKSVYFDGSFNNSSRFGQQTMQLSFKADIPAQENLVLFSTYYYNAVAAAQNGSTNITYA